MRSRTSDWFETKIRYAKTQEDGNQKNVTEAYVVDALSFTEAEAAITEEMKPYISGEYSVKAITKAPYHEIFFTDGLNDDKWYKAKLAFITLNEKTMKEKRTTTTYLVQAHTVEQARKNIDEVMSGTMVDYEISSIVETKLMDVFEHDNSGGQKAKRDAEKKREEADKKKAEKAEAEQETDKK